MTLALYLLFESFLDSSGHFLGGQAIGLASVNMPIEIPS
jgi:hypothetical protein